MRLLCALCFVVVSIGVAHAQQPFVPFAVDEGTYKQLQTYLGEQPAKFSWSLLNWLNGAEAKAVSDKAIADKAAADKAAAEAKAVSDKAIADKAAADKAAAEAKAVSDKAIADKAAADKAAAEAKKDVPAAPAMPPAPSQ
jgi:hypothetical protein